MDNVFVFFGGMLFMGLVLAICELGHRAADRRERQRRIQHLRPHAMQQYRWN